ncbi:hypothetical protein LX73_1127 [Fodinibius salinus]|uniref:Sugar lactone lactonase YvrE n=1 Tax=Fodinibius salinus TaxID=860790 RepID=A0A5D3YI19_9BACT|nr:hypothetical protein [Fodinibius salinus]TYP93423.1 hypothetical protein LX73_1127 [Fodinibius salinus]
MKRLVILIATGLLLALIGNLKAQSISQTLDVFSYPESVVATETHFYVSNIGAQGQSTAKDGDGFISKVKKNGDIEKLHFLPKDDSLNAPKGVTVINNTLYVTDIDRILGFDLDSGNRVFELTISEAKFLNDIVAKAPETLFVSDSNAGKIIRINVGQNSYQLLDLPAMKGPNGLTLSEDNMTLYCVGFGDDNKPNGPIYRINLDPLSHEVIGDYKGQLDGAQYRDGMLYFSDWVGFEKKGGIKKLNLSSGEITSVKLGAPLGGPADFFIDFENNTMFMPALLENKFHIISL